MASTMTAIIAGLARYGISVTFPAVDVPVVDLHDSGPR
jgi:hypothetical protein